MSSYLAWFGYGSSSGRKREQQEERETASENEKVKEVEVSKSPETKEEESNTPGVTTESTGIATEDNQNQVKNVETGTKDVAKNMGNLIFGFAAAAGKKLRESVDGTLEKGIIGDFQRENEKFIKQKHSRLKDEAVPPWVGYHEEEAMKTQILALSLDERNFLRDPPGGIDFHFALDSSMPVAMATLKEDSNLGQMRFKLVPRKISEFNFWRNYFYRVSLIKQSSQLLSLSKTDAKRQSSSSLDKLEVTTKKDDSEDNTADNTVRGGDDLPESSPTSQEFVSDSFQHHSDQALSKEEMQQLGVSAEKKDKTVDADDDIDDWEKELQDELQEFELVSDEVAEHGVTDPHWEKEIEDMLGLEETQERADI